MKNFRVSKCKPSHNSNVFPLMKKEITFSPHRDLFKTRFITILTPKKRVTNHQILSQTLKLHSKFKYCQQQNLLLKRKNKKQPKTSLLCNRVSIGIHVNRIGSVINCIFIILIKRFHCSAENKAFHPHSGERHKAESSGCLYLPSYLPLGFGANFGLRKT